jgi:hypothetical protein
MVRIRSSEFEFGFGLQSLGLGSGTFGDLDSAEYLGNFLRVFRSI